MYTKRLLKPPFFEIGPKQYLYGDEVLELALIAEEASKKYDVQVIFTTPFPDIRRVAEATENLIVFAPSMDPIPVGRGLANILPESVRAAGADGVMLNHVEKQLSYLTLKNTMDRANELNMLSLICSDSTVEAKAAALLAPTVITAEPNDLIGTGKASDLSYIRTSVDAIRSVNPDIYVLIGAGISCGQDVYNVIKEGADASGSSSAVACAKDKRAIVDEMLQACREAWDERTAK
ncbi:triose-phosphate isomerase [Fumia xinanensis]|uniref:Triose-phosphate isomerase n=1 Tax=Fumia xinanensis TaxID=2763659 RepID=A0A926I6P9_9FIRM|nr:triose-phosphate isomerase [Fumia xinanensis]